MDRPIGRKVLKFDSRLWRLRVVVAAAPQIKEGRGCAAGCGRLSAAGCAKGLCKRFPGLTGLAAFILAPQAPCLPSGTVSRLKGRPFYGQAKGQLWLTWRSYAGPPQYYITTLGRRPSNSPGGKAGPGQTPWTSALAHGPSTLAAKPRQPSGIQFPAAGDTVSPYFAAFILFTYTMSTDMSAGDTPEMREAWPRERGRILSSFCRASMEMPSRWR